MEIKITWFDPAMKSQVVSLFEKEYKTPPGYFTELFDLFYYHDYQKNKCLMAVALSGEQVIGFQSFFYWPYTLRGKTYNTFQSGNSLIHPEWRGKGVFNRMLKFIGDSMQVKEIDFFIGFPITASIKNLLKDNWTNPFNLHWWMRVVNPLGFFGRRIGAIKKTGRGMKALPTTHLPADKYILRPDAQFLAWRDSYSIHGKLFSYSYSSNKGEIVFHLKRNTRKKIINEVIIGNVLFSGKDMLSELEPALRKLVSDLRKSFCCHMVSFACNAGNSEITSRFESAGFKKLDKTIYFAVKTSTNVGELNKDGSWQLFRSDIDTW